MCGKMRNENRQNDTRYKQENEVAMGEKGVGGENEKEEGVRYKK